MACGCRRQSAPITPTYTDSRIIDVTLAPTPIITIVIPSFQTAEENSVSPVVPTNILEPVADSVLISYYKVEPVADTVLVSDNIINPNSLEIAPTIITETLSSVTEISASDTSDTYNIINVLQDKVRGNLRYVTKDISTKRKNFCISCNHIKIGLCTQCGCVINFKVRYEQSKCPVGKW